MHYPSDGPSLLAGILSRYTSMGVVTAVDGMSMRPNTIFVIPPAGGLILSSGRFILDDRAQKNRPNHPIDLFFRTFAAEAGKRAIAIILSGTGSDGAEGAKAVKEADGIIMVQEPASAKYPGMPRAPSTPGWRILFLPSALMPERIVEIARRLPSVRTPDLSGWQHSDEASAHHIRHRQGPRPATISAPTRRTPSCAGSSGAWR